MKFACGGSGSSGNCYLLEENGKILLMDAGIDIKSIKKLINWKVGDVVGSFISHSHT